jgi:hypothetical protein
MEFKLFRDKRGYSMTFWAVFIGFVMVPTMAMAIEVGRFFFTRSQIAASADASALAAAVEINQRQFISSGSLAFTSQTYAWAQKAVDINCEKLITLGVHPHVSNITIQGNTVNVEVSADLSLLFPAILPDITVAEWGKAEVRALRR